VIHSLFLVFLEKYKNNIAIYIALQTYKNEDGYLVILKKITEKPLFIYFVQWPIAFGF
jgi:hypothetical protein